MIDDASHTESFFVQRAFPFCLRKANNLLRIVQYRKLLPTIGVKFRQIHGVDNSGSAECVTELLGCHPRRKNAIRYFGRQPIVYSLTQRIRCFIETRAIERNFTIFGPVLASGLDGIKDRGSAIDRILKESFSIGRGAIAVTQSVPFRDTIRVPNVYRMLSECNAKRAKNCEHPGSRLCERQPISTVPTHA